jgi:predicted transcriptional regulator
MNTKLVNSMDAVARSRLVKTGCDASLVDAATLLSATQISLVVCDYDGVMVGVITSFRQSAAAAKAPAREQPRT